MLCKSMVKFDVSFVVIRPAAVKQLKLGNLTILMMPFHKQNKNIRQVYLTSGVFILFPSSDLIPSIDEMVIIIDI